MNLNDVIKATIFATKDQKDQVYQQMTQAFLANHASGIDKEVLDEEGRTPIINAVLHKNKTAIEWLMDDKQHPGCAITLTQDKNNKSAFDYAIEILSDNVG